VIVFISSPYRGDVENNIMQASEICRICALGGVTPYAPHLFFTRFLDDDDPAERSAGIDGGLEVMERCDEVWFFGEVLSAGMRAEANHAESLKKPVRFFGDAWRQPLQDTLDARLG
jgi:hypothetical protein